MQEIVDKTILFICCFAFLVMATIQDTVVVAAIMAIIVSMFITFFSQRYLANSFLCLYGLIAFFVPEACLFVPVMGYDLFHYNEWYYVCLYALPLMRNRFSLSFSENMVIVLFLLLAFLLERRMRQLKTLERRYFTSRDENMELLMRLEAKNNELMDKQDYEIHLATLHERNRIAREIHDNVGHMLSRSLLHVGALLAVHKESAITDDLTELKDTLSTTMASIRESVHDLHADSLDLGQSIRELLKDFSFCRVELDYDMEEHVDKNVTYCFLSVLRESLTNVTKHSNATKVCIYAREHPSFYQLAIHDNGEVDVPAFESGIGLNNMESRVHALHGVFRVDVEDGFKIFITIPKKP